MAKYRMVRTDFWSNPTAQEEMTPEDKYFYLYLLTNTYTTQIGIYKITKKQMAFDLGYSLESVHSIMERFIEHHELIRYNPQTREIAIRNWGKYNLHKAGKPVIDCILAEIKEVEDTTLLPYISIGIQKQEIRVLYESFCDQEKEMGDQDESTMELVIEELDDHTTVSNSVQEKQPLSFTTELENNIKNLPNNQKTKDVQEIIEFWDGNGFGFSNVNGKEQLLSWLDDSDFLQPKEMIIKAMNIACANNKRRLSYVVGILKNWENESLLTVEDIDSYQENHLANNRHAAQTPSMGRYIPRDFVLDLTDGDE
ncbi:DnaD domain protein [Neobacillus sp. DY30]|uniref:DnaD domain-containing protein n=1 Tax=Neobacillus sp. DY30 TaxID=3047871 RepID=UPI0024C08C5A|nr:DnaD domain protein [Neobacillus sp. DY30]WHY03300.1 DnaD domain protein [Neobacillus sp. DY30]